MGPKMTGKMICFAALGAVLTLPLFFVLGLLVTMLSETVWRPFGTLAPAYVLAAISLMGLPVGAYYGVRFALQSRGYSLGDYYRSIKKFLSDAR